MSAEIEMVEEDAVAQSNDRESAAVNGGYSNNGIAVVGEDNLKNDFYTVAAYGDLEKLKRLVEKKRIVKECHSLKRKPTKFSLIPRLVVFLAEERSEYRVIAIDSGMPIFLEGFSYAEIPYNSSSKIPELDNVMLQKLNCDEFGSCQYAGEQWLINKITFSAGKSMDTILSLVY
ncbi:hypothetical protein SADUNF_Sadunf16G0188500 [Salix dunnii]|uniref:Uncharacterized protein n=1 Tax=Salix dunnii TaxID=1413687 RepID=A0A835MHD6_9ROSI|nr:hypothetical protein SADUNF_Sadunf16G0188500 [Salix dunnii]